MFSPRSRFTPEISWAFLAAIFALLFDQVTKAWWHDQAIINTGISFSIGSGAEFVNLSLSVFFLCLLIFVSQQLLTERRISVLCAYGAFLGAGFSNLLDRWVYGGVRDIWEVPMLGVTNNSADWILFFAGIFLLFNEIIPMYSHLWKRK